jgi:NAD(P)-dependent dehydrogenase (short-subunit alcohol dehydrogenase family)
LKPPLANKELANKVCLIAGASGTIGAAVAECFCRQGARLVLAGNAHKADWCLEDRAASRIHHVQFNVCRWEEVKAAVAEAYDRFGAIDVLVNCTGTQGPIGPAHTLEPSEWAQAVETNLLGCFHLARAVVPIMLAQGGGRIIHFSGGGAAYARPNFSAYGASKAAIVRFTETLAEELRDSHIQVNAIAPGPVRSKMWDEMRTAGAAAGEKTLREIEQMEETGGVPPSRVAALALFLASSASNGLTGRLISGVHDRWEAFGPRITEIMNTDRGTLRRVPLD